MFTLYPSSETRNGDVTEWMKYFQAGHKPNTIRRYLYVMSYEFIQEHYKVYIACFYKMIDVSIFSWQLFKHSHKLNLFGITHKKKYIYAYEFNHITFL